MRSSHFVACVALTGALAVAGLAVPPSFAGTVVAPTVAINEVVASNSTGIADEDGARQDWVELHNYGDEAIDLEGWGLTDNPASLYKWTFPAVTMEPGAFLVVFASSKNRPTLPLHTSFAISAGGETIVLTTAGGVQADLAPATPLAADVSLGRQPDGLGPWHLFNTATPGAPNDTEAVLPSGPVTFSVEGGRRAPLDLVLSTSGAAVIHYTLDGSTPTATSPIYAGPIAIGSRTGEPNHFSDIQSSPDEIWLAPPTEVFKATLVRAVSILPGFDPGPVATHTYLVDPDIDSRYTLPIFSIVTDEDSLWGYENGIYVPGKIYDDNYDGALNWTSRTANYRQSGDSWERAVSLEVFETDGSTPIRQQVGIRIHGNLTRAFRRKSLRLYARSEYGASTLQHGFFPGDPLTTFKRLILRNGGQDGGSTLFRDAMQQSLLAGTGLATQAYRPVIVFLNGEYWGIHDIRERFDAQYVAYRYGADPDAVDMLTGDAEVDEGDAEHFLALRTFIFDGDMTDPDSYQWVKSQMDVDDYITYFAAEIYIRNTDWPQNNIDYWRPRTPEGRWRWLLYDTDIGFGFTGGSASWEFDSLGRVAENRAIHGLPLPGPNGRMFSELLASDEFRNAFLLRYAELMNTVFVPAKVIERIDAMAAALEPEIGEHIQRWLEPFSILRWHEEVEVMRQFALHRPSFARAHALDVFDLAGIAAITVETATPERGSIRVGSIDLAGAALPWSGVYFQGVPLPLVGQAALGYRFVGLLGLPANENGEVAFTPVGDAVLTAIFDACTNSVVDEGEDCDDGNGQSGDGCDAMCRSEVCGDGIVNNAGETCDDSGTIAGDGCSELCAAEFCGDAITNNIDEDCDDGDAGFAPGDACTAWCRAVPCGQPLNPASIHPLAGDSLFVLRAGVGNVACDLSVCDIDADGKTTAGDALSVLRVAVGYEVPMWCAAQ